RPLRLQAAEQVSRDSPVAGTVPRGLLGLPGPVVRRRPVLTQRAAPEAAASKRTSVVSSVAWSPDGQRLVSTSWLNLDTISQDSTVRLWDAPDEQRPLGPARKAPQTPREDRLARGTHPRRAVNRQRP